MGVRKCEASILRREITPMSRELVKKAPYLIIEP